jgi:hypothetical protein
MCYAVIFVRDVRSENSCQNVTPFTRCILYTLRIWKAQIIKKELERTVLYPI